VKYFKAILVISLIFIFPAVSYLYLRSGFIFRQDALEELKNEEALSTDLYSYLVMQDSTFFDSKSKLVNVFLDVKTDQDIKDMNFIAGSFKSRKDFSLTAMYNDSSVPSFQDTTYSRLINKIAADDFPQFFTDSSRILLTKENKIRKTYGYSLEDFNLAYEHIVILLPMKKREKLILIREDEK